MKTLIISYYYPPAGGVGLPGAQRVVKFISKFSNIVPHLLTVDPADYSVYLDLNFHKNLPIRHETIHRTSMFDVFELLLKLRSFLKLKREGDILDHKEKVNPTLPKDYGNEAYSSFGQRIKDFIYDLCYFPDGASGWIMPAISAGYRIIKREKIEIIFATGMPWSALVIAWMLHKITGVPYVVDFRDPWIGNPFHKSKGLFLDATGKLLEKKIIESAALICANTDPLREELCCRYAYLPSRKFITLPNGYDSEDFPDDSLLPKNNSDNDGLVLAHAGYLYGRRDPAPFVEALKSINNSFSQGQFKFLQMGKVELDYDFQARYASLIESGVIELPGMLPYQECLQRLCNADALILIQPGTKTQVPSKLYDYLCLNRPILTITPLDGALGQMIQKYGFGDVFEPSDVQGIAQRLNELAEMKRQNGHLSADYPQKVNFDITHITAFLEEHLIRLAKKAA